jgi:hypothetical protein
VSDTDANPLNKEVIRTLLKATGTYDKTTSVEGIGRPATTVLRAWFDAICAAADVEDKLLGTVPFELRPATHANKTDFDCSIDESKNAWGSIESLSCQMTRSRCSKEWSGISEKNGARCQRYKSRSCV